MRTGHGHRADLDAGQHDLDPRELARHEHEHAVARAHSALPELFCPAGGALRELVERARFDDTLGSEPHEGSPLRILGQDLDHVPGEVEPIGDLPAAGFEGRMQRGLEWTQAGELVGNGAITPAEWRKLHGQWFIDRIGLEPERS